MYKPRSQPLLLAWAFVGELFRSFCLIIEVVEYNHSLMSCPVPTISPRSVPLRLMQLNAAITRQ
jgi:hypothetical protein